MKTINDYYKGEVYSIPPYDIKIDTAIVGFNPPKGEADYAALKESIRLTGQAKPIFMRGKLLVDGFHRIKICKELKINVLTVDLLDDIDNKTLINLCNADTYTTRQFNGAQRAIQAAKLITQFGYTQTDAMKLTAVKGRADITAAQFLLANDVYVERYIDLLMSGERVEIRDASTGATLYRGHSLRTIRQKLLFIEAQTQEEEIEMKEVAIDYSSMIDTYKGEHKFWEKWGKHEGLSMADKLEIIGYLNAIYTRKDGVVKDPISEIEEEDKK